MGKKAILLVKDSKIRSRYQGAKAVIGTLHEKEKVLAPVLLDHLGVELSAVTWDTDQLGSFCGRYSRTRSVKETLRAKIAKTRELTGASLILASEGSFFPHPHFPFASLNVESLMWKDEDLNLEIYVEHRSHVTNHGELRFKPGDDLEPFLKQVQFGTHALILDHPSQSQVFQHKGVMKVDELEEKIRLGQRLFPNEELRLITDMRSHLNPTRQQSIAKAGQILCGVLLATCPKCETPGYRAVEGKPGLPCSWCGTSTDLIRMEKWSCSKCQSDEWKVINATADPAQCPSCNP